MPKKRLTELAEELGITYEEALDRVFKFLNEDMVSGTGKARWISEDGQVLLDDNTPMPIMYRGLVLSTLPNPSFISVKIRELGKKVPVRITRKLVGDAMIGKMIYVQATTKDDKQEFKWIKPPIV